MRIFNKYPYLIADIGVNFFDIAKKEGMSDMAAAKFMIEEAKGCGVDAVKFQSYKAETLSSKNSPAYWDLSEEPTTSQYELFKKYDKFGVGEYRELAEYCQQIGIKFLSTPFDFESADYLDEFMDIYKISSTDLTNIPFIKHIASKNKPILLSDKEIAMLKSVESASDHLISPLQDIEDILKMPVNYHIIPLFAFANAGVNFAGMSLMNLFSGVGLAVFLGLFVGKFCGVLSFSWLGIRLGIIQMPQNANWKSFAGVCMLCGIGFTVSMFMASLSYPTTNIDLLNNAKLGILCGTLTSAIVGCVMLKFFLPSEEEMNRLHLATEKQNEAE